MRKPKIKIGDSVIVRIGKCYHLVGIIRGYLNENDGEWNYWTSISGEIGYNLGYVKEKDIIDVIPNRYDSEINL